MGEVFKLNHCYNVDCVPAMELFPDNYFDLAVVDPPYFSGPERRGFYGSKEGQEFGKECTYQNCPAQGRKEGRRRTVQAHVQNHRCSMRTVQRVQH